MTWPLLVQSLKCTTCMVETLTSIHCGMWQICPLSTLITAYYLKALDEQWFQDRNYFYQRYMDDIIILAKTRWQL